MQRSTSREDAQQRILDRWRRLNSSTDAAEDRRTGEQIKWYGHQWRSHIRPPFCQPEEEKDRLSLDQAALRLNTTDEGVNRLVGWKLLSVYADPREVSDFETYELLGGEDHGWWRGLLDLEP